MDCSWYGPVGWHGTLKHWKKDLGYIDDLCAYMNTRSRVYLSKPYPLLNSLAFR
jgi:hypothetical protein